MHDNATTITRNPIEREHRVTVAVRDFMVSASPPASYTKKTHRARCSESNTRGHPVLMLFTVDNTSLLLFDQAPIKGIQ